MALFYKFISQKQLPNSFLGLSNLFLGKFLGTKKNRERWEKMRKKSYKGRCEKRMLSKCSSICRTYDLIQTSYAEILENDPDIVEIQCNVILEDLEDGVYMSDFLCTKTNNEKMVRECVQRKHLMKPLTVKLLDISRDYWLEHGIEDWGLVINEE